MTNFTTSQEWFEQSALLLQARPSTTRITTKYNYLPANHTSNKKRKRKTPPTTTHSTLETEDTDPTTKTEDTDSKLTLPSTSTQSLTQQRPPQASLTLKTYDPASGACLTYTTDKAAEVGRLVASLGRLGKRMAALPDDAGEDTVMGEGEVKQEVKVEEGVVEKVVQGVKQEVKQEIKVEGGAGGGAAKKKKKGKR